jgi:hypothetical protein
VIGQPHRVDPTVPAAAVSRPSPISRPSRFPLTIPSKPLKVQIRVRQLALVSANSSEFRKITAWFRQKQKKLCKFGLRNSSLLPQLQPMSVAQP